MATLALRDRDRLDGEAFHAFISAALPTYASPVFVRLRRELDVTGTFKLRKVDLQREGFDPRVVKDPLYLRDDIRRSYVPLTPERHEALLAGELRL